jgi:hypothetical protein
LILRVTGTTSPDVTGCYYAAASGCSASGAPTPYGNEPCYIRTDGAYVIIRTAFSVWQILNLPTVTMCWELDTSLPVGSYVPCSGGANTGTAIVATDNCVYCAQNPHFTTTTSTTVAP